MDYNWFSEYAKPKHLLHDNIQRRFNSLRRLRHVSHNAADNGNRGSLRHLHGVMAIHATVRWILSLDRHSATIKACRSQSCGFHRLRNLNTVDQRDKLGNLE